MVTIQELIRSGRGDTPLIEDRSPIPWEGTAAEAMEELEQNREHFLGHLNGHRLYVKIQPQIRLKPEELVRITCGSFELGKFETEAAVKALEKSNVITAAAKELEAAIRAASTEYDYGEEVGYEADKIDAE